MTGMSEAAKINAPRKRARVMSLPSDLFPDRLDVVLMDVHVPHLDAPLPATFGLSFSMIFASTHQISPSTEKNRYLPSGEM